MNALVLLCNHKDLIFQVIDAQLSKLQLNLRNINSSLSISNTGHWKTFTLILQTTPGELDECCAISKPY